jgi:phage shock protein PspC (stress-responsive transcriptional regulator)
MEEEMDNQPKRLYRSNKNRMLGGVCGGLAEYMNIDPTIIRLVAVVGFFATASAFFWAYLIMWIVVPEQPTTIL